jgi:pyruvate/2-oxoglutarate dehydrogenase complex dihydrolipoamide dehydrogenase (E3) component
LAQQFDYDIAVIGGGTAGLVSGFLAQTLGAKTVLIEKSRIGGECLWTGCVPSKTLIKSAKVFDTIQRSQEFGVHVEKSRVVWSALKLRIQDVRDDIRKNEKREIEKSGLQIINGEARFADANTLLINLNDGETTIRAQKFILACGTRVKIPAIKGLDDIEFLTHETIFDIPTLPRNLAIIGGGPIGCEMAQALARLGSKVTLFQKSEKLLPREDCEISALAFRVLKSSGVSVHVSTHIVRVENVDDEKIKLHWRDASGETQHTLVSKILIATGKESHLQPLNLEAAGVEYDARGVKVNDYLQTSVRNIWACGDVLGKFQFTHAAEFEAKIAVQNALLPLKKKVDYSALPWVTFLDPEVARVGLTEDEAKETHGEIRVFRVPLHEFDRAIIEGETLGIVKIVTPFVFAIQNGMLLAEFAETVFSYPTLSQLGQRAGDLWYRETLENEKVQRALKWLI